MADTIQGASHVELLAPVVYSMVFEELRDQLQHRDLTVEVNTTSDVVEELWATYPEAVRPALQTSDCTIRHTNESPPIGILLADERFFCLGVHDPFGRLLGTLANDSSASIDWASAVVQRFREGVDEVSVRG